MSVHCSGTPTSVHNGQFRLFRLSSLSFGRYAALWGRYRNRRVVWRAAGQLGSWAVGSWAAINPRSHFFYRYKVQFFLFFVEIFYLVWGIWPHFYTYFIVTVKTQKREILADHPNSIIGFHRCVTFY
jgi:hypothetical protein